MPNFIVVLECAGTHGRWSCELLGNLAVRVLPRVELEGTRATAVVQLVSCIRSFLATPLDRVTLSQCRKEMRLDNE